jgi:hypothetical protein
MSEEERKKLKEKIDGIIAELENILPECSQDDILRFFSIVSSYNTKYLQRNSRKMAEARMTNLGKAQKAAELSPKSKPARSRNMDTARLSRLSAMIVGKLGREPAPGDLVALGSKSYIFGGAPGGGVVVSVQEKGEIRECVFNWKNGRLERI